MIVVKKTNSITPDEWEQITTGFNEAFKREKKPEDLQWFYTSTVLGYSYHAMAKEGDTIFGHTTVAPMNYKVESGDNVLICQGGGTYVKKAYRSDIFIFKDMYTALQDFVKQDGVLAIVGVSNKNSFTYAIKIIKAKLLLYLTYKLLPLRLNKFIKKKELVFIDWLYSPLLTLYLFLIKGVSTFYNPKEAKSFFSIAYSEEVFKQRFNETYTTIQEGNYKFTYKIYEEKGLQICYLFDFTEKGERSLSALVKTIWHIKKNKQVDAVAFVGTLRLKQPILVQLPVSKEPQRLPLTIDVLVGIDNPLYQQLYDPANWNFGLLNFDVR